MAQDYFKKLVICSLFQGIEKDEDGGKIKNCKMHDIVHDLHN